MEYTFKAQEKSNSKRFLLKTCKLDEALLDQYMTQVMGKWGTYLDSEGKPVPVAVAEGGKPFGTEQVVDTKLTDADIHAMAHASMDAPEGNDADEEAPAPSADAFSNFALAQLTAPSNSAAPADQQAGRTSRESSTANGLKIEKNRPSQNGITRPSQGTTCHAVWTLCEKMTADLGRTVPLSALVEAAKGHEINQFTARTQYACWRKFNGIVGHLAK